MVEAPTRIEIGNVEDLVARMRIAAGESATPLSLDMRHVESISRSAGAFLCSALLTDLSEVQLDLLPPNRLPVEKLIESSLGFALAHRAGRVKVRAISDAVLNLERWRLPYTPARQLLPFDEYEIDEPSLAMRAQAAFVNPHQTARRSHRTDVPLRIQSWLHSVLPPRALDSRFLQDLHDLTFELVDNIAEHADTVGWSAKSIVQVSVARGKKADVRDRVWVLVMDTGPGIIATAAPKVLGKVAADVDDNAASALLSGLFVGGEGKLGRARGLGLPRVANICGRWRAAKLEVATGLWRFQVESGNRTVTKSSLDIKGTVVLARFNTPPVSAPDSK